MNGSEIVVVAPKDIAESKSLSKELSLSSLMPQALKKRPEDILAVVLTGAELGLAPMQAIRGIHIIDGKCSLSADLMGALVKRSPFCEYLALVESTQKIATYKTKRKGDPSETVMSFTFDQARTAQLLDKANWKKYPDAMLRARCLSSICRAVYPDQCLGIYDPDELDAAPETVSSSQAVHIESVKAQLKTAITDTVEGEIVPQPGIVGEVFVEKIKETATKDALLSLAKEIAELPESERQALRPIFMTKMTEFTQEKSK